MKSVISGNNDADKVKAIIANFKSSGKILSSGRNEIRIFDLDGLKLNVKSFKIPNFVNKITYKYFRKSKAHRSYEYAKILEVKGIGTPAPIAFFENCKTAVFKESFYVCEHLKADLTYRDLVINPDFPDHEKILREFTCFTYDLHQKEIQFLDHSPGNTLIQKKGEEYKFYLVDLNRMNFKELSFDERMQNFSRLTPKKEMVEVMADEYSKLIDKPKTEVFEKMWFYTNQFQEKLQRKRKLKAFFKSGNP